MRELSLNEVQQVNGGWYIVIPPAVKFVAWVGAGIAGGAGAYYGGQHGSAAYNYFFS